MNDDSNDSQQTKKNIVQPLFISLIYGGIFAFITSLILMSNILLKSNIINITIFFVIVFCIVFVFLFIIYFFIISGKNVSKACCVIAIILFFTIFPIFLIFISGNRSFVEVFENSVGYFICSMLYNDNLNNMFKYSDDFFKKPSIQDKFKPNKNVLLTLFNITDIDNEGNNIDSLDKLKHSNVTFDGGNDNISNLINYIKKKNIIGVLCWFYIVSVYSTMVSIKYLSTI